MKINLAQQNQASTLPDRAVFVRPTRVTPTVKSGEAHILSFNGDRASGTSGKSTDPTCYNSPIVKSSMEKPMQKFQAAYESMSAAEAVARKRGWDGGDHMLDYLDDHPRAVRTFNTQAEAEAWLIQEINAMKSLFGCGDIDVLEPPERRCRYCTCGGWLTVASFIVEDTGIVDERRDLPEECTD